MSRVTGLVLVLVFAFASSGCEPPVETSQADLSAAESTTPVPASSPPASSTPASSTSTETEAGRQLATFVAVVDGDTIQTSAGAVRLIGIDTPEEAECGHEEASAAIGSLLSAGDQVTLELPEGQNDRDRYDSADPLCHHLRRLRPQAGATPGR